MARHHFYDLPVYRVNQDAYYSVRDAFIEKTIFHSGEPSEQFQREFYERYPEEKSRFQYHLEKSYGGCWNFNEIIGYIRLHFLGSQVRGEYFSVSRKRLVRTRNKTFEFQTWKLAPEVEIEPPYGNAEVLSAVREYISDCEKELPKRYIDQSVFNAIAPYIEWSALLLATR